MKTTLVENSSNEIQQHRKCTDTWKAWFKFSFLFLFFCLLICICSSSSIVKSKKQKKTKNQKSILYILLLIIYDALLKYLCRPECQMALCRDHPCFVWDTTTWRDMYFLSSHSPFILNVESQIFYFFIIFFRLLITCGRVHCGAQ